MSYVKYDANNSYITLGNQLLLNNQMMQQLMVSENSPDRVYAIEDLVGTLEGMLAHYYPFMKLEYFDQDLKRMVKIEGYENSMKYITEKLVKNRGAIEDRVTRGKYIYWLNRKYQLLSSCYGKLKLVPELSGGSDMGAVEDQIPEEVSDSFEIEGEEEELNPDGFSDIIEKDQSPPRKPMGRPPGKKNEQKKEELTELEKIHLEYQKKIAEAEKEMGIPSKATQTTQVNKRGVDPVDEPDFELEDEPTPE